MSGFSVSLSDMRQDAYEMELIVSMLKKKSENLEQLGAKVQSQSRDAGRQISNANCQLEGKINNGLFKIFR